MAAMLVTTAFDQLKRESLRKLRDMEDKSPKGSVDAPIVDMIKMINDHPNYVTSSSCSGRIAVFCGVAAGAAAATEDGATSSTDHLITKGGKWLLAEHGTVTMDQLRTALDSGCVATSSQSAPATASNMVIFKHEPFIMHVVCRDVDAAKELLQCGIACGFRESGVVLGNKKIMCAIRTTANAMEIPLGSAVEKLLVSDQYLAWLVDVANEKFVANRKKTDQLCAAFQKRFLAQAAPSATGSTRTALSKRAASSISLRQSRALESTDATRLLLQRVGHSSVAYNNSVYVFGGQGQTPAGTSSRLADLVVISSSEGSTSEPLSVAVAQEDSAPPSPRMHHTAVVVGDKMVVFGGRAGPLKCFNDVHAFDFTTQKWSQLAITHSKSDDNDGSETVAGPAARWKHSCGVVGSTMYVYGGRDSSTVFGDLFALDLAAEELVWRKIDCSDGPDARFDHVGVALSGSKELLVWGGLASLDETTGADAGRRDVCWLFDTATQQWRQRTIKNADQGPVCGLFGTTACAVDDGAHVVVCGGTSAASASGGTKSSPQKIFSLSTSTMEWQLLGSLDSSSMGTSNSDANSTAPDTQSRTTAFVYSTSTWLPAQNKLLVLGGGFQVFGFGQCYSSSFVCELVVVRKDGGATTSKPAVATPVATTTTAIPTSTPTSDVSPTLDVSRPLGVLAQKTQVKAMKTLLESAQVYDKTRRVHVVPDRQLSSETNGSSNTNPAFLLPVTPEIATARLTNAVLHALEIVVDEDAYANKFGKATGSNRNDVVRQTILACATRHALPADVLAAIPDKYEFVSDVLMVPRGSFLEAEWTDAILHEMWAAVCIATTPRLSRVARKAFIDAGEKRQSRVELLFVDPTTPIQSSRPSERGWVEVRENGITYGWDLTKVMFSSGNVTEKARMATVGCQGDVIVDLFCGIGYYVVPFLVHGGAAFVHACEWNPDSVDALQFNLKRNCVAHKCQIYAGDNQINAPLIGAVADRVNLGLLPTSEKAWPLAVQVLKPQGGWMHVHDNVAVENRETWEQHVVASIAALGLQYGKRWRVTCEHIEKVKSYAPKVHHLVADIRCVAISE